MRRFHLFETVDLNWWPQVLRDGATDWLRFMIDSHKNFNLMAPKLRDTLNKMGTSQIIDLCAGGAGPWLTLETELAKTGEVQILLSDFFPNEKAFRYTLEQSGGRIRFHPERVDAMNVPSSLKGVRTIFSGLHHFRPEQVQAILADAVNTRQAIVVIEGSDHRLYGSLFMLTMPLFMLLLMPFVKPFRWSRLFFTYLVPILPIAGLWDGMVSMLRTYTPDELREIIDRIPGQEAFSWDIGTQAIPGSPIGITYLIGTPNSTVS